MIELPTGGTRLITLALLQFIALGKFAAKRRWLLVTIERVHPTEDGTVRTMLAIDSLGAGIFNITYQKILETPSEHNAYERG